MILPSWLTRAVLPAGCLALVLAAAACGSPAGNTSDASASAGSGSDGAGSAPPGAVSVVASTDVYGSIASAVGGDRVRVVSIINSASADPHEYEATPRDATAVAKATVVIANGGGYDDFMTKLISAAGANPASIDVSELSGLHTGASTEFNEHVWYSLPTMTKLADRLADELGKADSADAATFAANAKAFDAGITALQTKVAAIKAKHAEAPVAITEPVPLYLLEAAGLKNTTPAEFSEAVEQGNDPPAAVLQDTLALFSGPDTVDALVPNAQTETAATKQVEQAATAAKVPIVTMTETLPAGTTSYLAWMGGQIDALSAALDGH